MKTDNFNKCIHNKYKIYKKEEEFYKKNWNWKILLLIILFQLITSIW